MDVFKEIKDKFGTWIQVLDKENSGVTIEDFDYSKGVHGAITTKHCVKCVSANKCWFKNENDKKPTPFEVFGIETIDNVINTITPGLYHFRCHCYELDIITPNENDIKLIIPDGKVGWLFLDKKDWVSSWGYDNEEEFLDLLYKLIKKAYCVGSYKIIGHDNYGVKINLYITIPGVGKKRQHSYKIKSGFSIFPNGKLKCNTLVGGQWK